MSLGSLDAENPWSRGIGKFTIEREALKRDRSGSLMSRELDIRVDRHPWTSGPSQSSESAGHRVFAFFLDLLF